MEYNSTLPYNSMNTYNADYEMWYLGNTPVISGWLGDTQVYPPTEGGEGQQECGNSLGHFINNNDWYSDGNSAVSDYSFKVHRPSNTAGGTDGDLDHVDIEHLWDDYVSGDFVWLENITTGEITKLTFAGFGKYQWYYTISFWENIQNLKLVERGHEWRLLDEPCVEEGKPSDGVYRMEAGWNAGMVVSAEPGLNQVGVTTDVMEDIDTFYFSKAKSSYGAFTEEHIKAGEWFLVSDDGGKYYGEFTGETSDDGSVIMAKCNRIESSGNFIIGNVDYVILGYFAEFRAEGDNRLFEEIILGDE